MDADSTVIESPIVSSLGSQPGTLSARSSDYADAKEDCPSILNQLGEFISFNCTHGAKTPVVIEVEGQSAHMCCLKCAVDFIFKERVKSKITTRLQPES